MPIFAVNLHKCFMDYEILSDVPSAWVWASENELSFLGELFF